MNRASELFSAVPHRHNCAQAVACGCGGEDLYNELQSCGGGRAPGGVCGALYAAQLLNPEHAGEIAAAAQAAGRCSCIVLGTCNAHLKPGQQELMRALGSLGKPMIVVALRNPYDLLRMPERSAGIAAWEYTARSLQTLVPFLAGKREFKGKMPLTRVIF